MLREPEVPMLFPVGSRTVFSFELIDQFPVMQFRVRCLSLTDKGFAQCGYFVLLLPRVMEDEHRLSATRGVD